MQYFKHLLFQKDYPDFTDKQNICLADNHRFFALSKALSSQNMPDILSYGEDNELLLADIKEKINQDYQYITKYCNRPIPNACVLLLITNETNPKILLTRRASHLSSHAGEVSFVGGKKDLGDASSYQIALREAKEEIGLASEDVELLGFLPMQFSKKGLLVRPLVAAADPKICQLLTPNADEIEKIFWVDLEFFYHNSPKDYCFHRFVDGQSITLHTPAWIIDDANNSEIIWGLTGRILDNFIHITTAKASNKWYFKQR